MINSNINRRRFLVTSAGTAIAFASTPMLAPGFTLQRKAKPKWHSVEDWGLEGRGFDNTAKYFDRLPARAEKTVRAAVWNLSRHSAGMMVRFNTDSSNIDVHYKLSSGSLSMSHMPATSVSGLDLYAKNDDGEWRWAAVVKPNKQEMNVGLLNNIKPTPAGSPREFRLYLPLYNGMESLEIGVDEDCQFEGVAPRTEKPVVFYGTSIMHGACASRSGMAFPAILGRRLDVPTINLGFSGNGKMEKAVAEFLCLLDPSVYVIDCLPNMNGSAVTERCEPLVRQLRQARPETPILLVEDRVNTSAWIRGGMEERHATNRKALKAAFDRLIASGENNLFYLSCDQLLGSDGEGATDGSHPSDLGMYRYADAYEPVLRKILSA